MATKFGGECWTISAPARDRWGLHWILGLDRPGLSPEPHAIHTGRNSGFQAINLAYHFGAARIILLGFDMQVGQDGRRHWHGDHPKGLANGGEGRYRGWIDALDQLVIDLKRTPCKIFNATRRTAIRSIQRVTLESALNENNQGPL